MLAQAALRLQCECGHPRADALLTTVGPVPRACRRDRDFAAMCSHEPFDVQGEPTVQDSGITSATSPSHGRELEPANARPRVWILCRRGVGLLNDLGGLRSRRLRAYIDSAMPFDMLVEAQVGAPIDDAGPGLLTAAQLSAVASIVYSG